VKKIDLAELQKRLQSRAVLAISLETNEFTVALLKRETHEVRTGRSFSVPIGADAALADPERAGAALAEALEREHIRERRCVISLPRRWALTSTGEAPEMNTEDLRAFLELRAERDFSTQPGELRLAHHTFSLGDGKQYATLAGVPNKRLEALQRFLEAAGCRAVSIALGLDRSARIGASEPALQFQANCDHVDVIVAAGGGVTALRTLPGPTESGFDAPAFLREVRITLGRLPEPLRKKISSARFSGPAQNVKILVQAASDPLQRLGIAQVEAEPAGAVAHPAIDAAERFLKNEPVLFELVERETKPWQNVLTRLEDKRQRNFALIGLAVIVLPILIFMIRSHIENSLDSEWRSMRGQVADLESLQQRIRQFRPWFDPTPQALQCMETLAGCFPENGELWAKSIQLSEAGKVTCVGLAKNQSAILTLLDRLRAQKAVAQLQLQSVKGDNPISFTIIFQWEPK
jgi:hypothetical protein